MVRKKVAAYARVSTEHEEQQSSRAAMKLYFGSIEDIASFRHALFNDDRYKPEDMEFMSAKLYGAKFNSQAAGK